MRSVEVAPRGPRPPIRLRPVPPFDPPFDDEVAPEVWASVHQLAFDWTGLRAQEAPTPVGSIGEPATGAAVESVAGATAGSAGPAAGPGTGTSGGPCVAGASTDAKTAVRRFVSVCVEVINGYRPPAHLRRLSLPGEAAGIVAQALAAARRVADVRRASGPSRVANRHGRRPDPVAVLRLRLCEPRPGAVEAAVLLVTGERTWALALRLERHQQSWVATTLRVI